MNTLGFVNLVQATIVGVGLLGAFLLWRVRDFRGLALLLALIALASTINILEESGLTRDIYLLSPVFVLLFGPATYLAAKYAISRPFSYVQYCHLLPVLPLLFFTSSAHIVIAVGTAWRLLYTILTVRFLLQYKRRLASERSDAEEFSLTWFMWLLVALTMFNFVDLLRLNFQPFIPMELNLLGQGINNIVWLVASFVMILQFTTLTQLPHANATPKPAQQNPTQNVPDTMSEHSDYHAIFHELDDAIQRNQWFLKPRLTLNDLSEMTGLQTRDISRAINLHANRSFNEYVNRFRVEAVCQRLANGSTATLSDIAQQAGFSSKASFNKVFKACLGVTPSQYKASLKS